MAKVASAAVDNRFSPDAWERLVRLPTWLFLRVAAAQGPIDPRAASCFDQHIVGRSIGLLPTAAPLVKAIYREVASRGIPETLAACRSLGARGATDFESAQRDLRATLRPEEYEAFVVELLGDAAAFAGASTGAIRAGAAAALGQCLRVLNLPPSADRARVAAVVAPDWLHPGGAAELMGFVTGRGESAPRLRAWRRREALLAGSPGLCARLGADEVSLAEVDFEYTSKHAGDGDGRLFSLAARRGPTAWRVVFSGRARLGAAVKLTPPRCAAATLGSLRLSHAIASGA